MNIAKILNSSRENSETNCESGRYVLVTENGDEIASHGCSNRGFANHDLTEWKLEELQDNNIDIVVSDGKVVWTKDGDNSETMKEFYIANSKYESEHCFR